MRIAIFAAIALLSGCVSAYTPPPPDPGPELRSIDYAATQKRIAERMNGRMTSLLGQNIHAAVDLFGYPDATREVIGDKVYTWTYRRAFPEPSGGPPVLFSCTIEIGADQADTIKNTHWEGSGCAHYTGNY